MKKLLVLVLLFAVMGAAQLFAQDFSSLPAGSWDDRNANWDGTWTFSATGVTIRDNATGQSTTFTTANIQDLKAVRAGMQAGISFASATLGKTFSFFPNLTDGTMLLIIVRPNEDEYRVSMPKR